MMLRTRVAAATFLFTSAALAQTVLTQTTVITGQCSGHEKEPGCVLPNLFGSNGLSLQVVPGSFQHFAHFVGSAQTTLNQTLSTSIATQLAVLPIISPASGFTYRYDSSTGTFVRTTSSFGPIYTERAETIGRHHVSFGVSYQRFRFSSLDGVNLHNLPAVFTHLAEVPFQPFLADVIRTNNNISLNMDQTLLYGTLGLTDHLDVSVAVPIVSVRMGAVSNTTIVRVSGDTLTINGISGIPNPHAFAGGGLTNTYTSNGSATGVGDVTIRVKGNVLRTDLFSVALAADVRTPSGNARELLGSGAWGIKPFVAISAGKRVSPHLNVGYQWNGKSILAGDVTGTTFGEDANSNPTVTNGAAIKQDLPDQFFYSAGLDVGVNNRLTLAFDYLGQLLISAPRVFNANVNTLVVPGGLANSLTLPSISGGKDDVGLNNGAAGLKLRLAGNLLLTADVLFRLDNHGLRQDVTPLIGLSYAFGGH